MPVVSDIITQYKQEILRDAPTGYWPLETAGFAVDHRPSASPHPGAYTSVVPGPGVKGVGPSMQFAGSSGVNLGALAGIFDGVSLPLTFEAWINPSSVSGDQSIIGRWGGNGSAQSFLFELSGSEILGAVYDGSGTYIVSTSSGAGIAVGRWTHLIMKWVTSGALLIYKDGRALSVGTSPAGPVAALNASASNNWYIGQDDPGDSKFFHGAIAHAAVYQSDLSSARILAHYNALANPRVRRVYSIPSGGTVATRLLSLRRKMMVAA